MVVSARNLRKEYGATTALAGVSIDIGVGEFVAIVGPSGCGKSTLLHLCGAMDRPSSGDVIFDGTPLAALDDEGITRLRRERIGFVFQFFNLLPTLTVVENVSLPLLLAGQPAGRADAQARALVERLGLADRLGHYPSQLSGGEMQRTAIARAILHRPALLIADEPTGNLDSDNGARTLTILTDLNRTEKLAILLATHDRGVANAAHRILHMRDGRIVAGATHASPASDTSPARDTSPVRDT
jgi:putative ABC transport system ATP-binding protein